MDSFQVGPETFITLEVEVLDAEGEVAAEKETVGVVFGMGGLFPEAEKALEGKLPGDRLEVKMTAEAGFGERRADAILHVDKSEFPPDVAVGDRFELENEDGGLLVVHVLDVTEEEVVIDTNHPLADQDLTFRIHILEVRAANSDEIAEAEDSLLRGDEELVPDVGLGQLLSGGGKKPD